MTTKTKLEVRRAEIRKKLAELAAADGDVAADEIKALTGEITDIETRLSALAVADDADGQGTGEGDGEGTGEGDGTEPDGEAKELFGLVTRASVGNYLERAASGRPLDGAEAELNAGYKVTGGDRMPIAMLMPQIEDRARIEDRADAATALTVNTVQKPEAWLPRVFEGTATAHLGITRKSVSGLAAFPVVGSGATAKTVDKAVAQDAEAFGLTVETLDPLRISARYLFSKEDAARLGPSTFEDALRSDMRMSLTSQIDDELINGQDKTGPAALLEGLLESVTPTLITGGTDAAMSDATSGLEFAKGLLGLIDGKYAMDSGDLRYITNAAFYAHAKTLGVLIDSADTSPKAANEFLNTEGVRGKASAHIGEISGQAGESYVIISLAKGLAGAAVHAVWDSVEIIRDPFTNAAKGQVALTLCMLHNFKVIRDDNFKIRRVART